MRIGILLTGDYGWAGGLYYSLNIIRLLQAEAENRPLSIVVIVNSSTPRELIREIENRHTTVADLDQKSWIYRAWCKVAGKLLGTNTRFIKDINGLRLDVLYPLINYEPAHEKLNCRRYYWIYDFQHKFLPELFTAEEISRRDATFRDIAEKAKHIVLSSYDAEVHFQNFYPQSKATVHVYRFVSLMDSGLQPSLRTTVPSDYFMVCNQFWPHKNHLVVLKAIALLVQRGKSVHVVFTGKYDDQRNQHYVQELRAFIREHRLDALVTLTGFISREEQTTLMANARAIIQPSFFEGWSTVIEDAKALRKFLVVSDIAINREQVADSVLFFSPASEQELADHMQNLNGQEVHQRAISYDADIRRSQETLTKILLN